MDKTNVALTVKALILQVAKDQSIPIDKVENHHSIVEDLNFSSLDVATLASLLETTFEVDPFSRNMAVITEIRTVNDICKLYERCLTDTSSSTKEKCSLQEDFNRGELRRKMRQKKITRRGDAE